VAKYCHKCMAETERYATGECKPCKRSYTSAYRAANREKERARKAAWCAENTERVKARKAAWHAANREKVKARHAAWYAENTEMVKARMKAWYAENTERGKVSMKAWYAENIEKVKARYAAYRAGIPDKYVENIIRKSNNLIRQIQIPPEMIEAKRAELKLKRLIKELKNENT